ncbi:MAG: hypothetical protein US31_C0001G0074 [Berkelbacteria bacterium GW2011_GWA1_36_9]|uniref:Uncharacterized protein n=1 Tax=Berkelbacteria bacterium GW2011_GWA1_36_9 TaxID=1618331 RepID=A0A0G0FM44_9BACT|nr:MAG: hypothetical protein US31_C0001G0074 [Berkelbacteria bacterium GW2011_GWA1_36_9]
MGTEHEGVIPSEGTNTERSPEEKIAELQEVKKLRDEESVIWEELGKIEDEYVTSRENKYHELVELFVNFDKTLLPELMSRYSLLYEEIRQKSESENQSKWQDHTLAIFEDHHCKIAAVEEAVDEMSCVSCPTIIKRVLPSETDQEKFNNLSAKQQTSRKDMGNVFAMYKSQSGLEELQEFFLSKMTSGEQTQDEQ